MSKDESDGQFFPDELDRLAVDEGDDSESSPPVEVANESEDPEEDTRPNDERMTGAPTIEKENQAGMIEDGLDRNETILMLGLTALSYAFAWGILSVMVDEGLSSTPLTLWAILALIVSVPLVALFGTGFSDTISSMMRR